MKEIIVFGFSDLEKRNSNRSVGSNQYYNSKQAIPAIQSKHVKLDDAPLKGMKGYWGNSTSGQSQFNVCLNVVGTHYEIAFDKEFVYQNADAVAV